MYNIKGIGCDSMECRDEFLHDFLSTSHTCSPATLVDYMPALPFWFIFALYGLVSML